MAHSESQMSASRRFTMSKPMSTPLPASGGRGPAAAGGGQPGVERFSPLGSTLPPYHPGSIIAANNNNNSRTIKLNNPQAKSYACRKIRNDISDEEKQEILMAFELFDSRKSGKLNSTELKVAMRALEFHVKKEDVRKIIQEQTKGRSDEIDQDDFIEILTKKYKEKDPEEDLLKAFKYFDEDNTGKISLKNLRKIAKDLGEHITDEELAAMIDECRTFVPFIHTRLEDGLLSHYSFKEHIKKTRQGWRRRKEMILIFDDPEVKSVAFDLAGALVGNALSPALNGGDTSITQQASMMDQ